MHSSSGMILCLALLTLDLRSNLTTAMKSSQFARAAVSKKKPKAGI